MTDKSDVLFGRKTICDYAKLTERSFYGWIQKGLPAQKLEGTGWISHKKAIDEFFYNLAKQKS